MIGRVEVGEGTDWRTATVAATNVPSGIHDLIVTQSGAKAVDVDWVSFRHE